MTSTAAAADVPIPPGLTCPICMDVFRDPVLVPCCSNTFCRTCLDQALARNDACPICRAPILAVGDPVLPNRAVAALVQAAESAIILMPEEGEGGGQWLQSPSIGVGGVRSGSGSSAVAGGRQLLLGGGSVSIGGASSSPSSPSAARSSIEGHVAGSPSSIVMMTRGTLDSSSPSSIVMMTRGSLDSSSSSELPASGPVLWWPSRHSRSSAGGGVLWGIGGGGGREGGGGRGGAEMDVHRHDQGLLSAPPYWALNRFSLLSSSPLLYRAVSRFLKLWRLFKANEPRLRCLFYIGLVALLMIFLRVQEEEYGRQAAEGHN